MDKLHYIIYDDGTTQAVYITDIENTKEIEKIIKESEINGSYSIADIKNKFPDNVFEVLADSDNDLNELTELLTDKANEFKTTESIIF